MKATRPALIAWPTILAASLLLCSCPGGIEVESGVRPHLERFLDLAIQQEYREIYDSYLGTHPLSFDEFCDRMNHFAVIFDGELESYSYHRSYTGGAAYFIQYGLQLSDGTTLPCFFSFPARRDDPLGPQDLRSMSVSADFGSKSFDIDFRTGIVLACQAPTGCYGEDENT
jgi:hypothetical protein